MNNFQRVQQWLVFSREWHLLDAKWQCPLRLSEKIAKYLRGLHKPIYYPTSDCGDHVIVYNCRHIAMKGFDWKRREYLFDNRWPRGKAHYQSWEIHKHQPTRILWMEVYRAVTNEVWADRRNVMERLHLIADEDIPPLLLKNASNQMEQVMRVPKRIDEYTEEERRNFPALFDWPRDYVKHYEYNPGEPKIPP